MLQRRIGFDAVLPHRFGIHHHSGELLADHRDLAAVVCHRGQIAAADLLGLEALGAVGNGVDAPLVAGHIPLVAVPRLTAHRQIRHILRRAVVIGQVAHRPDLAGQGGRHHSALFFVLTDRAEDGAAPGDAAERGLFLVIVVILHNPPIGQIFRDHGFAAVGHADAQLVAGRQTGDGIGHPAAQRFPAFSVLAVQQRTVGAARHIPLVPAGDGIQIGVHAGAAFFKVGAVLREHHRALIAHRQQLAVVRDNVAQRHADRAFQIGCFFGVHIHRADLAVGADGDKIHMVRRDRAIPCRFRRFVRFL